MDPQTAMVLINLAIQTARNIYEASKEINGADALPSWESIISGNDALQTKIDAEKTRGGE